MNREFDRWHSQLMDSSILDYPLWRGLTKETIVKYKIGLIYDSKHERGFINQKLSLHEEFGNIDEYQKFSFSNRVVIPIRDIKGQIIGMTARTIADLDGRFLNKQQKSYQSYCRKKGINPPKYKNTRGTKLYKKSESLFNIDRIDTPYCWLVEAQLSAIGTNQALDTSSALGLGGTAFTDGHIALLRAKGIRYVCLTLDPDKAGYKAMYSIAIKLLANGFKVKVAILPNGKDPMDLIQVGETEELKRILTNPIYATEYIVRYFNSQNKDLSFFRYIQKVEEFFKEVDTSKLSKLKDPKPKTLGWFINRSKK